MNKNFSVLLVLLFSCNLFAQENALLWKISGKGLSKPSYLFGTVHMHCDPKSIEKPVLVNALKTVDFVVMELDLNDFSTFVALSKAAMKKGAKPVSEYLSLSDKKLLDSACLAFLGDSLKVFNELDAMVIASKFLVSEKFSGCNPIPVDILISELARKYSRQTHGLETYDFQDSLINTIPDTLKVRWLMDMCKNPLSVKKGMEDLMTAYNAQNSTDLYRLTFETSPEMVYLKEGFLDKRNQAWLEFLQLNFPDLTMFVAVGAAHLGGEQGMISLLRKAGYTLTPIKLE